MDHLHMCVYPLSLYMYIYIYMCIYISIYRGIQVMYHVCAHTFMYYISDALEQAVANCQIELLRLTLDQSYGGNIISGLAGGSHQRPPKRDPKRGPKLFGRK